MYNLADFTKKKNNGFLKTVGLVGLGAAGTAAVVNRKKLGRLLAGIEDIPTKKTPTATKKEVAVIKRVDPTIQEKVVVKPSEIIKESDEQVKSYTTKKGKVVKSFRRLRRVRTTRKPIIVSPNSLNREVKLSSRSVEKIRALNNKSNKVKQLSSKERLVELRAKKNRKPAANITNKTSVDKSIARNKNKPDRSFDDRKQSRVAAQVKTPKPAAKKPKYKTVRSINGKGEIIIDSKLGSVNSRYIDNLFSIGDEINPYNVKIKYVVNNKRKDSFFLDTDRADDSLVMEVNEFISDKQVIHDFIYVNSVFNYPASRINTGKLKPWMKEISNKVRKEYRLSKDADDRHIFDEALRYYNISEFEKVLNRRIRELSSIPSESLSKDDQYNLIALRNINKYFGELKLSMTEGLKIRRNNQLKSKENKILDFIGSRIKSNNSDAEFKNYNLGDFSNGY